MIDLMFLIGLIPIILVFLLFSFFVGRVAKKNGNNPWLWGCITIAFLIIITWQKLPRWAGMITTWEVSALHTHVEQKHVVANPDVTEQFTLRSRENIYTLTLPVRYRTEQSPAYLARVVCKYPSMEASPDALLGDGVVVLYITTERGYTNRPELYLKQVAAYKVLGEFVGKQDDYDVYQAKNAVTGKFDKTWLFTAKDSQLVMVDSGINDTHSAWRNINPDLAVRYNFSSVLGSDFIKIDEAVVGFIKAHLQSTSIKFKGTDK